MERPVYLREDAYQVILRSLAALDDTDIAPALRSCGYSITNNMTHDNMAAAVMEEPTRYLYYRCDILSHPDLLTDLFIDFDDDELDAGLTYLIDREAAEEIVAGEATILLRSGQEGVIVSRTRIENAFATGCTIDYRERH